VQITRLTAYFFNALSSDNLANLPTRVFENINVDWSQISVRVWNNLPLNYVSTLDYEKIKHLCNSVSWLEVDVLNVLSVDTINKMINNPRPYSWEFDATNLADFISSTIYLALDGTKYGALIQSLPATQINGFASDTAVMNSVRLDALNALSDATIAGLNVNFVNHLSNTLMQAIGNDSIAGARFLNALSRDVNSAVGNVVAQLDINKWINAQNNSPITPAVWSALDAGFYNAMSTATVTACIGYGVINCIADVKISALSLEFLNAISAGTVSLMISNNWNGNVRASGSPASFISKDKWLALDGVKYDSLLKTVTSDADIQAITNVPSSSLSLIRADALNALSTNVISKIPATFLSSLPAQVRDGLSREFLAAAFPTESVSYLQEVNPVVSLLTMGSTESVASSFPELSQANLDNSSQNLTTTTNVSEGGVVVFNGDLNKSNISNIYDLLIQEINQSLETMGALNASFNFEEITPPVFYIFADGSQ
jgi:hypothetical protein